MDRKLIYRKTAAGESSLRERTRLRRSRLRAVLILVDGQTPAGTICEHLGAGFRPNATLNQLEKLGLIEPVLCEPALLEAAPLDASDASESAAPASMEIVAGAEDFSLPSEYLNLAETTPAQTETAEHRGTDDARSLTPPHPVGLPSDANLPATATPLAYVPPDLGAGPSPTAAVTLPEGRTEPHEGRGHPARPSLLGRLEDRLGSLRRGRRRARRAIGWKSAVALAMAACLVALGLTALWFPYDRYRTELEGHASQLLGQPVTIGAMRIALLPRPGLDLRSVRIGSPALGSASVVRLIPIPRTLFFADQVLADLQVEGLEAGAPAVAALCSGAARIPADGGRLGVRAIRLSDLALRLGGMEIAGLQGEARLRPGQEVAALKLANKDNNLSLNVFAGDRGCRVVASARAWPMPFRGGLRVESMEATATLTEKNLRIDRIEARLEDGLISGGADLGWASAASLDLRLNLRRVELAKLLPVLGIAAGVEGLANGSLRVVAQARDIAALEKSLAGGGSISVSRGALNRVDLVEAVRTAGATVIRGGKTPFEELSAQLEFQGGSSALRGLRIDAGALRAEGFVDVDSRDQLRGAVVASIRGPGGVRSVPLRVGGTLPTPLLEPAREN